MSIYVLFNELINRLCTQVLKIKFLQIGLYLYLDLYLLFTKGPKAEKCH
jgi:hypothetical protein